MHVLQQSKETTDVKHLNPHSWQFWKLHSESGRQRWVFDSSAMLNGFLRTSDESIALINSMTEDFLFNKMENPNAVDEVFWKSTMNPPTVSEMPDWVGNPLIYPNSLSMKAAESGYHGIKHLNALQQDDGHWPGDYGGPLFLLPALVFASYITYTPFPVAKEKLMIRYMLNHQNEDGGWGLHIEGDSTMFGTVMQYCALRILGMDPSVVELEDARSWIKKHGGITAIPSWGKFFLALIGMYEWDGCNSLLPELWLLPRWMPFHPGRYWCHARMVYLPMSYCYGYRIQSKERALTDEIRNELYDGNYGEINWENQRNKVCDRDLLKPMNRILKGLYQLLGLYEKAPVQKLRERALKFTLEYINAEDQQTNFINIGPVNQIINSICIWHAYGKDSDKFKRHISRWDDYLWIAEDGMKMNGYNGSQLWDTTFTVQSLLENPDAGTPASMLTRAYKFIESTQIREEVMDRIRYFRHPSVGGWPFSTRDHGWPISDCTAEGVKAVLRLHRAGIRGQKEGDHITDQRLQQAVDLILSWQNKNGGWGTYEKKRSGSWLEILNPSDVFGNIMVDYSWVECTSACITALVEFLEDYPDYRSNEIEKTIIKGIKYLKSKQNSDGSWTGAWGICFTYGTWFGIEALTKTREYADNYAHIQKACNFLVSRQRVDGGWGESHLSCTKEKYVQHKNSQVVNTSWALMALMAADYPVKKVVEKGISLLLNRQLDTGGWPQEGISGVFNKNCMITYSAYKNVFPIWALERYIHEYSRNMRHHQSTIFESTI